MSLSVNRSAEGRLHGALSKVLSSRHHMPASLLYITQQCPPKVFPLPSRNSPSATRTLKGLIPLPINRLASRQELSSQSPLPSVSTSEGNSQKSFFPCDFLSNLYSMLLAT